MGTPLGPKYIPYTYMDPLGQQLKLRKMRNYPNILLSATTSGFLGTYGVTYLA